jgi:hypothetical protein
MEANRIAEGQKSAHHADANFKINTGAYDKVAITQPLTKHEVVLAIF